MHITIGLKSKFQQINIIGNSSLYNSLIIQFYIDKLISILKITELMY